MEGVMMRNNDRYAVAVRKPDKQIEVKTNRCTGTSDRPAVCNLPIVRGVFSFVQSLTIGVKTLMYSAQFFEDEEEEAPKKEKKKMQELMASIAVGDSVLTSSGFYGVIIDMTDDTVIVEFGNNKNCRIPMQKQAIVQVEKPEA